MRDGVAFVVLERDRKATQIPPRHMPQHGMVFGEPPSIGMFLGPSPQANVAGRRIDAPEPSTAEAPCPTEKPNPPRCELWRIFFQQRPNEFLWSHAFTHPEENGRERGPLPEHRESRSPFPSTRQAYSSVSSAGFSSAGLAPADGSWSPISSPSLASISAWMFSWLGA